MHSADCRIDVVRLNCDPAHVHYMTSTCSSRLLLRRMTRHDLVSLSSKPEERVINGLKGPCPAMLIAHYPLLMSIRMKLLSLRHARSGCHRAVEFDMSFVRQSHNITVGVGHKYGNSTSFYENNFLASFS